MIDREEDIAKELAVIEQRLKKSRTIGEMTFNQSIGYDPEYVKFMNETGNVRYLHFEKPRAVRDEVLVSPEHINTLQQQITFFRSWLFQNGHSGKSYPDYREWIREGFRTEVEMAQYYWYRSGLFEITCDKKEHRSQSIDIHRLLFISNSHFHNLDSLDATFGFKNDFNLRLEFGNKLPVAYDVSGKLEDMTLQEFRITAFFLDHFQQTQLK